MTIRQKLIAGFLGVSLSVAAAVFLGAGIVFTAISCVLISLLAGYVLSGAISDPLRKLEEALRDRERAEEALQQANERLSRWVDELEQRNQEIILLSEMGSLLQTCLTADEIYAVVNQSVRHLFTDEPGVVYICDQARSVLQPAISWGGFQPGMPEHEPNACWSLRLGRPHLAIDSPPEARCEHLGSPYPDAYLCVPMIAQGNILGLLHLQFRHDPATHPEDMRKILEEHKQPLAVAVAESIAFCLANLKLHESLYVQSIHDSLTGLFNRRYMEESLERELHRMLRKDRPLGIIMLDLDHFKKFNDTFGHQAGDTLLRELGAFLQGHVREEDFACRYGGEEFVIILPETPLDISLQRAEQLREDIRLLDVRHQGQPLGAVTLSLGVAGFPEHGTAGDALLRSADSALYKAKSSGRDRVISARDLSTDA